MRRTRSLLARFVLAAALVASAAACGSSNDQTTTTAPTMRPGSSVTTAGSTSSTGAGTTAAPSTTTTTKAPGSTTSVTPGSSTTTATPPDDDGGIDPMNGASTNPQSAPDTGTSAALLQAVRVARHEGFDRVVFEFRDHVPGYKVEYTTKPILADPSGEDVTLAGTYAIKVRMAAASGVDQSGGGTPQQTYTGPKRIAAGTPEITEVVESGDFEAVLSWVIGTGDKADFRVFTLTSPARIVVDVRNH